MAPVAPEPLIDVVLKWNEKQNRFDNFRANELMDEKETQQMVKMAAKKLNEQLLKTSMWSCLSQKNPEIGDEITKEELETLHIKVCEPIKKERDIHTMEITFPGNDAKSEKLFNEFSALVLRMHVIRACYID